MTAADPVVKPGELDVVRMLANGLTITAIARRLHIATSAVSQRLARAAARLGTTSTVQTVLACERRGLLGGKTKRAMQVRRELADRHSSTCALLAPPVCDCGADLAHRVNGAA
jgi:DNA-binding CsgD family transcriptional regulator